jgi:hypothetical protein
LYAKSARNRENSVTQQSGRKQGKKKGGDAYDLGGAKQRTAIDEKKDEARTKNEGGKISECGFSRESFG